MSVRYRAYLTPRVNLEEYGVEIDVSNYVRGDNIGSITRSIDSSEYNIGVFTYNDMKIVMDNSKGLFNDENDSRSMFPYSRDQAKVRIVFDADEGDTSTTFRGMIADESTRLDPTTDDISFRLVGRDSVLNKSRVASGTVTDGMTFQNALIAILNSSEITRVLGFDAGNIDVDYNGVVDVASAFTGKTKKEAVNELLAASNSVMLLDEDDNMIVRSRDEDTVNEPLVLYGPGDIHQRENITDLPDYNTGLHRLFNQIKVNDTLVEDSTSITTYGARKKEFTFDWITAGATCTAVATAILNTFRYLKTELTVELRTKVARNYDLLDRVSIDYPLIRRPAGDFFPVCGITPCGDVDSPTPFVSGSVIIDPSVAFKIIEIVEDPKQFLTQLKCRVIGTGTSDGVFE